MNRDPLRVVVARRYPAPPDKVFRAFTEPALLSRWFSPSQDIATDVVEHDLREGGKYRFGFRFPDGHQNFVAGRFEEIARPHRIVFTWTWEEPDPHAGIETLVTIEIVRQGDETEVSINHERFPDLETRNRHDQGWGGTLDRLRELLRTEG